VRTHARAAYRKADRQPASAERWFWRGGSQLIELLAVNMAQRGRRSMDVADLLRMPAHASQLRAAASDLEKALVADSTLADARILLVLLRDCRGSDLRRCRDKLWLSLNQPRWVATEAKYLTLNLLYAAGTAEEIQERAVPLALELHLRHASNPLFHLALMKISYEAGDREEALTHSREIVARAAAYGGTFAHEARYYLGVLALERSDCRTGIQPLMEVVRARPKNPEYLMPWSLLRLAQCHAALGRREAAIASAREVLTHANVEEVHSQARVLIASSRRPR
jgi:hypothetical protein